jgi:hypothetical protein
VWARQLVGVWARQLAHTADCSRVQVFNLWRKGCDAAARIAFSDELRDAAAELLGCEHSQLRLYQVSVHRLLVACPHRVSSRDLTPKPELELEGSSLCVVLSYIRIPEHAQDSIFHKRLGDAPTRWHCDLNMAPLDTNRFLTVRTQAAATCTHRTTQGYRAPNLGHAS